MNAHDDDFAPIESTNPDEGRRDDHWVAAIFGTLGCSCSGLGALIGGVVGLVLGGRYGLQIAGNGTVGSGLVWMFETMKGGLKGTVVGFLVGLVTAGAAMGVHAQLRRR